MIFSCVGLFWTGGFSAAEMSCVVAEERESSAGLVSFVTFRYLISLSYFRLSFYWPFSGYSFFKAATSSPAFSVYLLPWTIKYPSTFRILAFIVALSKDGFTFAFFFQSAGPTYSFSQNFLTFPLRAVLTTGLPAVVEKWELGWSVSSLLTVDLKVAVFTVS